MARNPYFSGAGVKGAGGVAKGGMTGAGSGGKASTQQFSNQGRGPKSISIPDSASHFRGGSQSSGSPNTRNSGGHTDGVTKPMKASSSGSQNSSMGGHRVVSGDDKKHGC